MLFVGSMSHVNSALDGLVFTPEAGYSGLANLVMTVSDLGNDGHSGTGGVGITSNNVDMYINCDPALRGR